MRPRWRSYMTESAASRKDTLRKSEKEASACQAVKNSVLALVS